MKYTKHHRHIDLSLLLVFNLGKWNFFYTIKGLHCSFILSIVTLKFELYHFQLKFSFPTIFVNKEKFKKNGIWTQKFLRPKAVTAVIFSLYQSLFFPGMLQNNKVPISLGKVKLFCLFVAFSYTSVEAIVLPFS